MGRTGLIIVLLVLPAFTACTLVGPGEEGMDAPIQTDHTLYEAVLRHDGLSRVEVSIPMAFRNITDEVVYLIGCRTPSQPVLEKHVGGEWVAAWVPIERLCLSPPWHVAPGATFRDTLRVTGFLPGHNAAPTFDTEIDGTYRLVRAIWSVPEPDAKAQGLLPLPYRVSNTFEIRQRQQEPSDRSTFQRDQG